MEQACCSGGEDDLAIKLARMFADFGPAYMKWVQSQIPTGELTYPRMRLLMALHFKGSQIMSSLSEELSVTPRNITVLVDGLEHEQLVVRKAHPSDRRAIYVELTCQGRELAERLYREHFASVARLFSDFTASDQHELLRLLDLLHQALEREGIFRESLSSLRTRCIE